MGGKTAQAPSATIDKREPNATASHPFPGSPLIPNGDPMLAEVGPGAYALRADTPDVTYQGHDRIVPMRIATDFKIEHRDPDPRGMPVLGADGAQGGIVRDVWIDRSEYLIRYLEVEIAAKAGGNGKAGEGAAPQPTTRRVLLPMNFCGVDRTNRKITVGAILGKQFANAPGLKSADRVTLLEEERIAAYYGGGLLYATPDRQEPLL
jgi:photosynthetic reaction center H subunit